MCMMRDPLNDPGLQMQSPQNGKYFPFMLQSIALQSILKKC